MAGFGSDPDLVTGTNRPGKRAGYLGYERKDTLFTVEVPYTMYKVYINRIFKTFI